MPVDVIFSYASTAGISVFADKLQRDIRQKFQLSAKISTKKEDPKSGIFDVIVDGTLVHSVTKLRHSTQVSSAERNRIYEAIQSAIDRPAQANATAEGYSRPGSQMETHSDKPQVNIHYGGRNEHKVDEYKLFAARKKDDFKKMFGDLVDVHLIQDKGKEDVLEIFITGTARACYTTRRGDPPQVRLEDFHNMVSLIKRQLPQGKEASPGSKKVEAPAGEPELMRSAPEPEAKAKPQPQVTAIEEMSPKSVDGRRGSHNNIRNQFAEMDEALDKGLMKPVNVTVMYSAEASHHIHATKLFDELQREYGKKVIVEMIKDDTKKLHMEVTVAGKLVHSQAKKGHSAQIHIDELHCLKNYISNELVKSR